MRLTHLLAAALLMTSPMMTVGWAQTQQPPPIEDSETAASSSPEARLEATPPPAQPSGSLTLQPSLWLESGLAYRGQDGLLPHLRIGFRGVQPLSETVALYGAFAIDGDLMLDLGGWYSFLPGGDDLFGFRSYAGTGLSYVAGSVGLALSAAVTYDLSPQTALLLVYTHRPLLLPELGQAFDVSLGVRIVVPE